jgi:hypothetical protein
MSLFNWGSKSAAAAKLPTLDGFAARDGTKNEVTKGDIILEVKSATFESFLGVLSWLPEDSVLRFYDQYYPTNDTDPGAYITIQRKAPRQGRLSPIGEFQFRMGNHGWSSDWVSQSPELLAAWMALNVRPKTPRPNEPLKEITIKKIVPRKPA